MAWDEYGWVVVGREWIPETQIHGFDLKRTCACGGGDGVKRSFNSWVGIFCPI